ncbi:MAG TPA: SH3 domain-containing protein, partial [Candidatus Cryosericum sp.]|nr:SH3 domain-containing protein [Candidatus Cryosericum sp.]
NIGKTYREILGYYYPGATMGTMGYTFPEAVGSTQPQAAATSASAGKVKGGTVNLRAKASTSASVVEQLAVDTALTLLGMTGEWYYVSTPSGNTGYIRYDYVLITGSSMIARGVVSGSAVNYRTGPGTSYSTIGQLSLDTQLGIYGMVDGWYKVKAMTTGADGFVSKSYVTITAETAENQTPPTPTPAGQATATPTIAPTPTVPGATPTPIVIGAATPTPTPAATPSTTLAPEFAASGVLNAAGVNIRAGASTSAKSYGKLMKNTAVGLYEKKGSWYRVRVLSTGLDGYVYAKYVTITQTASSGSGSTCSSPGYINASGVYVRKGASTRYNSLGKFARYTSVKVIASSGSWYQIEIPSADITGYVLAKYVTLTSTTKQDTQTGVVTSRLNLRAQPSTSSGSKVLLVMDKGATVTVYSTTNGWCYVSYNGTMGYCVASCVKLG